ncbi:uncharacterized protein LOC132612187 [Lycium barbarum]|uniref:uncharacterized protein LOC132612187 n=1 Tax=Lycium barbarum TaxID=112863 RepID=UPI00293F2320|nr:uncharacterized protein LOC132612187 [Lycium barbarum]
MQLIQLGFADDLLLFSRGDLGSVQLMYTIFQEFSSVSGLIANKDKSSIYFGGVPNEDQRRILYFLGIPKGELPIKYLGVPLCAKRISVVQYQPLLEKMLGRITSWTTLFLSYAGRMQLLKSVLFSIQVFWSQLFVLPRKVIKMIEAICRTFLWTGGIDVSKKALLAWDKICGPKEAGGWNVLDITIWNRAAITKLLWTLHSKKDKLWVQWVHTYYGKHKNLWDEEVKQASWMIRKILKAKKYIKAVGISPDEFIAMSYYSIKAMYQKLKGEAPRVHWWRLFCHNEGLFRWLFTFNLAAHGRLATRDRLKKWGMTNDVVCPLCDGNDESINHLFFECAYVAGVWNKLLVWQGIHRQAMTWNHELTWACSHIKGRRPGEEIYKMELAGCVYQVWHERNQCIFQSKRRPANQLVRGIIQQICARGRMKSKLARTLDKLNFYP